MTKYVCRVYIDKAKRMRWPTDFVTCPRVGDLVASECGYRMVVTNITHCIHRVSTGLMSGEMKPYIEVELGTIQ